MLKADGGVFLGGKRAMSSSPLERLSRRDFLSAGAVFGASVALTACGRDPTAPERDRAGPTFSHGPAGTLHLFMDESGAWDEAELFVVGLLATTDPVGQRLAVNGIKSAHGFIRELHYGSTDRFKVPVALDLFDHLLADGSDLSFAAAAMQPDRRAHGVMRWQIYRELLSSVNGNPTPEVTLEQRTVDGLSDDMLAQMIAGFGSGFVVREIPAGAENLLQVADLLTGCVYGDFMRRRLGRSTPNGQRTRNSVKDEIIDELKRRLGVRSLVHPSLAERDDFRVRVLNPAEVR